MTDGDLRMLGACDGFAIALVWIRNEIDRIDGHYAPRINLHHTRRRAARDATLRPLKELETRLAKNHAETQVAYRKTREAPI